MAYRSRVIVVFDRTAEIAAAFAAEGRQIVHETADAIKQKAVDGSPEVTGSLKAGWYVTDDRGSGFSAAVVAAGALNASLGVVPEVPAEPNTSIISNVAEHAAISEFYTGPVNPGQHPTLGPAAERERPAFEAKVARIGGNIR